MNRYMKGQSIAEFLVSLAFFVPVLLLIPTLANMLLVQTTAHEASRYVAWERTAYSSADLKSGDEMAAEVQDRFLQSEDAGFGIGVPDASVVRFRDFKTSTSMIDFASDVGMNVDSTRSATAGNQNTSAWLANRGGVLDPSNAVELDTLQSAKLTIPLSADLSLVQPTRAVNAWHYEDDGEASPPLDPVAGESRFYIASSSALVADGWMSVSDEMFHDRVYGINTISRAAMNGYENSFVSSILSSVGFDEIPDRLFISDDGKRASLDMVDPEQSLNLPSSLKEYE